MKVPGVLGLQGSNPLAITTQGVSTLDPATGEVVNTYPIPPQAAGSTVTPIGSGFVVGAASTSVYR
jgi:hypothetical protein